MMADVCSDTLGELETIFGFLFVCVQEGDKIFYWNPITAHHSITTPALERDINSFYYVHNIILLYVARLT